MSELHVVALPRRDEDFGTVAQRLAERIPPELGQGEEALAWYAEELRRYYPDAVVHAQDELARTRPGSTVWYVHNRGPVFRIDTFVDVPLSPDRAYEVYVERVAEWQTAVRLVDRGRTPGLVGTEYEAYFDFLGHTYTGRFRVRAADPPSSVSMEAEGSGIAVWYVTRFEPLGPELTRVGVKGDYRLPEGLLVRIADRLFLERTIAREIERANQTYVSLCATLQHAGAPGNQAGR